MSHEQEQFLTTVAQHAQLSWEAAERPPRRRSQPSPSAYRRERRATWPRRLPREIAPWPRIDGGAEGFGADEFVRRVAERQGTEPATAAPHARAVFADVSRRAPGRAHVSRRDVIGHTGAPPIRRRQEASR